LALAKIVTAVATRLEAVASVRNVYDYLREAKDGKKFIDLFQDKEGLKNLHTWMITRERTDKKDEGISLTRHTHHIVMMGYFAVNDLQQSETTFQGIIEDACQAFDPLPLRQYTGTVAAGMVDWSQPVQVEGPTVLMYGNYLVHAVKLLHKVEELVYS
jgi:hypothetical protein